MKILLVDAFVDGHHRIYMEELVNKMSLSGHDLYLIFPTTTNYEKTIVKPFPQNKNIFQYLIDRRKWISQIWGIARDIHPDVVHFLTGDALYQLGGQGFSRVVSNSYSVSMTLHHLPKSITRKTLLKLTSKKTNKIVVHTESIKRSLCKIGILDSKIDVIDYPILHTDNLNSTTAKEKLKMPPDRPLMAYLGETRESKGLDILLEALKYIDNDYHLVIAGKAVTFDYQYIQKAICGLNGTFTVNLSFLSNEEFGWYIDAADCILLPYRKSFSGASGPMAEAIWRRKPIIGPNHGSIGDLISRYKLGYSFESENTGDLAGVIKKYLEDPKSFKWSEEAEEYRKRLEPNTFAKRYLELFMLMQRTLSKGGIL